MNVFSVYSKFLPLYETVLLVETLQFYRYLTEQSILNHLFIFLYSFSNKTCSVDFKRRCGTSWKMCAIAFVVISTSYPRATKCNPRFASGSFELTYLLFFLYLLYITFLKILMFCSLILYQNTRIPNAIML